MAVNQAALPYLLLSLLGNSPFNEEKVQVNVNTDNLDGSITVPKWVLAQAVGSAFGYIPTNNWAYDDDDTLPSSMRIDSDFYEIRVDMGAYDKDRVKVKVIDNKTIRVEAKQRYVNKWGATTSRTVQRRFSVPTTYDVDKLDARMNHDGTLIVNIPNKNGNILNISSYGRNVRVDY